MVNARPLTVPCLLLCTALLAGCGSPGGRPGEGTGAGGAEGHPVTIDNCGREVVVDAPPERAVSLDQGSTEILLSLGLADRIAGTAKWTDPLPEELAAEEEAVPRLAENLPSYERVLEAEPDFVSASFVSTLGAGGVADRDDFEELGVPTYMSPADCTGKDNGTGGDGTREEPLELDTILTEVTDLARIFGVPERGEELTAELRARVEEAAEGVEASDTVLMYWFSDSEAPYMGGCCGAPGIITEAVGARNAFDDTRDEWPQINWEAVADRDPDHIVLGDLTREAQTAESAEDKIAFLESDPVTRHMKAVEQQNYIIVSGQALNPGIRTVEGIEQVAAALEEEAG
ncbi:ABC transporter substrate-binding protein [Nocardiopsis composta]